MSTLQETISYDGSAGNAPVDAIELQFQLPVYEYFKDDGDIEIGGDAVRVAKFTRRVAAVRPVSLTTTVDAKSYRQELPDETLIGNDKRLFGRYLATGLATGNIEYFFTTVDVDYVADLQFAIGTQTVELIFFPKLGSDDLMSKAVSDDASSLLFVLNRTAFFALLKKVAEKAPAFSPLLLLEIISLFVDLHGSKPAFSKKVAASTRQDLLQRIKKEGLEGGTAILEYVQKGFDTLFDIPLRIPEVRTVALGGTFTVVTPDQTPIKGQDLLRYDLSASYVDRGTGVLRTLHYAFGTDADIQENSAKFAFDDAALFRENIDGPITVKVLGGPNGAPLWSRNFKATDPGLDSIEIRVPLVGGGGLVAVGDPNVQDAAKKLRGQVLDLSKKCPLKDLTVLIQAKREGDNAWRVVAAANTDKSGTFSMPYPYGAFTKAQAIVSLTPNDPAGIPIVSVANPNQTIADDFLYLLLENVVCDKEKDEDCGCNSKNDPSRLPDFADLIGSNEYSQDIGGSCVNLSTPNRTLSEFNYLAIVRTSDPEVANYTLRKVEPHVADIATVLNALSASSTAANAVLGVLNGLNADLNASLSPLDAAINSASNSTLTALGVVLNRLNITFEPLYTAPVPSLSASLTPLNAASTAANTFNGSLNDAIGPLKQAISAANAAANSALQAAMNVAQPDPTNLFAFLTGTQNAGSNAWFNPLNSFMASASDAASAAQTAALKSALDLALGNANSALNTALAAAQPALTAAMNALSAVNNADASAYYELVGGATKIARRTVDLDNPISWQDAPDDPSAAQAPVIYKKQRQGFGTNAGGTTSSGVAFDGGKNLSFYQAVTVATGHILHYKSLFKADGYSLGDLVYSLPLAPGQKKEIVVFDASHTLQGAESQLLSQGERLNASISNERDLLTQLSGTITETMRGSSTANTSGVSAGFGTGGQGSGSMGGQGSTGGFGGSGSAVIGVAGGIANSNANAEQDSSRVVSQFFADKLRQSIMQNAESYRQLNASVVTTVQEGQRYGVTSEVVANHNHCHALTMMYFEVLRHYAIYQKLSSVEECVFVPLLMTNFTTQNVYKWRDVLARFLLPMPSETYLPSPVLTSGGGRQHPLLRAFDANERIKTRYANVDFPEGSYDDEQIQFVSGTLRLRVDLPRPRTRFDRIKSFPLTKQVDAQALGYDALKYSQDMAAYSTKAAVTAGIWTLFNAPPYPPNPQQYEVVAREAMFDAFMSLDANFQTVPPAECIRIKNFKPPASIAAGIGFPQLTSTSTPESFFAENIEDQNQWQAYAEVLGYNNVLDLLNAYFAGNLISEWDAIFYNDIVPLVFEKIVSSIGISEIASDFSSESRYKGGERLMRLNFTGNCSRKRNQLPLRLRLNVNNSRLVKLKEFVTLDMTDMTLTYSTAHFSGVLFSGNVNDDLLDGTEIYLPESADEKRNPRKEDAYLVAKLIEHLNSNLEYYNKVLWFNLDPDRRYMLLDGFGIQTYNDFGLPVDKDGHQIPLRSLASVVKNELVTITGNSMVFPVAAGYRVSQDYIVERVADEGDTDGDGQKTKAVTLVDHYQPITPIEPFRISVPTKGVFCEAVQGACNACEKIETNRLQDWNRFPNTDEPTPIAPVTPPAVAVTDWRAAFKDFAPPVVNIQNAPAAPEPGAGLAAITELLGKSGVFKDITGLDGTQKNVLATYLSNQENAKAFGEMAKEMAMQNHNTQNSGRIMDSISQAKSSGDLSKEDAARLTKDHLQQQIDGGQTKKAELDREKQNNPTQATKAWVEATNRGQGGKFETRDADGNLLSATVEAGDDSGDKVLAEANPPVEPRKQQTLKDCWAVAATMMMNWKSQSSGSIEDALVPAGDKFLQIYKNDTGLAAADKDEFVGLLKMVAEPPSSQPAKTYIDWMNRFGPLWITTDADPQAGLFSPHARILIKITGTGTSDDGTKFTFIDPDTGQVEKPQTFLEFQAAFEQMATDNKSKTLFPQVVHFAEEITGNTEGGKPAPAQKTGLSTLANQQGETRPLVETVLSESKDWIDAVGDGIAQWKDNPSAELSGSIGDALYEAAKEAAATATDDIPFVKAMKTAVKYSLVFADGIGVGLETAGRTLTQKYDRALKADTENGLDNDDYEAILNVRRYQLNSVNELNGILLSGINAVVDAMIEELAGSVVGGLMKKFTGISKSFLGYLLNKSPLKAVIYGSLEFGGKGISNERQEIYRAVLSTALSLFIRQLDSPALRTKLAAFTKLGGTDPMGKALVKAIASCLVDSANQDPAVKEFMKSVKSDSRAWIIQHLKELIDGLATGVAAVPTDGDLAVVNDEIRIPRRLFQEIQLGSAALADDDYRKSMDVTLAMQEVKKATAARLTLLTHARQPKLVYLNNHGNYEDYGRAYDRFWQEVADECTKLTLLYRAAGADPSRIMDTMDVLLFESFDIQFPLRWLTWRYVIVTGKFDGTVPIGGTKK